jgi:serine/threonine-protein kinase RsbT
MMDDTIGLRESFAVEKGDFVRAGEASSRIKRTLRQIGVDPAVVRRASIAVYEAEMNLVIHTDGGTIDMIVEPTVLRLVSTDFGPGIADVELAMREGYSTASEDIRMMGFGAGMGLPNIRRNCNRFDIFSKLGEGTRISMEFDLPQGQGGGGNGDATTFGTAG